MSSQLKDKDKTEVITTAASGRTSANLDDVRTAINRAIVGRLVVTGGPGRGETFHLFDGTHSIGRDASNHIVFNFGDTTVHRKDHALLTFDSGRFVLIDNGKANPVEINGRQVMGRKAVGDRDHVTIGKTACRIELT